MRMSCLLNFVPFRVKFVDNKMWAEAFIANNYAVFIGYLSMAVKGLGFLVLTWTTVVLLGGFVSDLEKEDFWCLAFITLAQTAGIFDVLLTEKLSYLGDSLVGYAVVNWEAGSLLNFLATVQAVVFVILLCPLAAVYAVGLLISAGLSVWRLQQLHLEGYAKQNLKQALYVLYSLALLQGVTFCYKFLFSLAKGSVSNRVVREREFEDEYDVGILKYLSETMAGCEKDPSFTKERNLIRYAVDLMGSKSPDDYLSGVMILDGFARKTERVTKLWQEKNEVARYSVRWMEENIVMKHLIMPASSSDILQKLLQTLDVRSIYDRKTRGRAARTVASIASDIRLEDFPRGILYISSLIGTFEEYCFLEPYERNWVHETFEHDWYQAGLYMIEHPDSNGDCDEDDEEEETDDESDEESDLLDTYKELVVQGFHILQKLATNDENCRVMLNTPFLLDKIMAPVTSDLLHHIDHGAWSSIVEGSLKVMAQLTTATGQTGTKLRHKISRSKEAISAMERITQCGKCNAKLQKQVILILTHLHEDTYSGLKPARRQTFIETLVNIMTDDNKDKVCSTKKATPVTADKKDKEAKQVKTANKAKEDAKMEEEENTEREKEARRVAAAEALVALCSKTEAGATIIMKANENVVDNLTAMIFEKGKHRSIAAEILEYLCIHYTDDDAILKKLQKAMTDAVPKLLGEILCWASQETQKGKKTDEVRVIETETGTETDVENQRGDSQDIGLENNSPSSQQKEYKMNEYDVFHMLSLCVTVWDTLINADQDLTHQFDSITPRDCASSFPKRLKVIVDKNKKPGPHRLRILKLTCKVVISMMKHRGRYVKKDLKRVTSALSIASKSERMLLLEGSMVIDVKHHSAMKPKPFRSLASLVKEAKELVEKHNGF